MTILFLALGLVLVVEGLALALAPSRISDLLAFLAGLTPEQRRLTGLASVATGAALLALWRWLGA